MVVPKINSSHGSETRNIINAAIDAINVQGKTIQDLVAEGQLTLEQYAELITIINSNLKSGEVGIFDLTPELRLEVNRISEKINKGEVTESDITGTLQSLVNSIPNKINHGEVTLYDIDKNNFKIDQTMIAESLLQQIAGTAEVNSIPADNSITSQKMANKSVTPEKTTMFNNANLFDENALTMNKSFDESGNIIDDASRATTNFIPVNPSEQLSITPMSYRIVYYDENLDKVSERLGTSGGLFEVYRTDNIRFMRLSGIKEAMLNGDIMLNRGTTLLPYEVFGMLKREHIPEIEDGSITENLLNEDITNRLLPETIIKTNLFDVSRLKYGNITSGGIVVDSSSIMVTDYYIDVKGGHPYTFTVGELRQAQGFTWKVAYYDVSGSNIITHSFPNVLENTSWTVDAPKNAKTSLVSATVTAVDTFTVVIGNDSYKSSDEGKVYDNGIWDIISKPKLDDESVEERHLSPQLLNKISSGGAVNKKYPNPPRMNFEVFTTDSLIPLWLDKTGETMYLHTYNRLKQTTDEFETVVNIGEPFDRAIKGMRILSDGELLVTVSRNESEGVKATAYKSVNYDSLNPEATTFKLVHTATGEASDFYNRWGLDVYDNIVLLGEYGVKNGTGARRVYLSTDNAETFKEIFWQESVYAEHGIPYDAASAHVHTVKYDPYFSRIWVVCGDGINTGTFYSDDLGINWNVVEGSTGLTAVQYTGIAVLPDCVVFGSDRSPNGLHIFERSLSKSDEVTIKPWAIINNHDVTSHIFQMPFQRDVGEPYYFGSGWDIRAGVGHAVIMSFINKDSVQTVFETPMLPDGTKSPPATDVIGATKSGYVYASWHDGVTWNIARAKEPVWESV